MRKVTLFTISVLFFAISTNVVDAEESIKLTNSNGIQINEVEYERLINLGFTAKEIKSMEVEEFELNKDLDGQVASESTKYYEFTEEVKEEINLLRSTGTLFCDDVIAVSTSKKGAVIGLYMTLIIVSSQIYCLGLVSSILILKGIYPFSLVPSNIGGSGLLGDSWFL
ncbi:hypothetical protein [Paucisalibacillus globulus]|uniref:hypothetical protein n=1 Tax=Paucisalibacillus globulus TaxID=351095 RepID=UPI000BB870CA|nr:hypothetical protein [Paucisalibacillus globulus]